MKVESAQPRMSEKESFANNGNKVEKGASSLVKTKIREITLASSPGDRSNLAGRLFAKEPWHAV